MSTEEESALIGYNGFVGSNIQLSAEKHGFNFSNLFNSSNIDSIKGKHFKLVVSAGTKGARWIANQDPEADWQGIKVLLEALEEVKTDHFVLVSTVDVYPNPVKVDEDTKIDEAQLTQAYGKNRFRMEQFIMRNFPSVTVVRCPQLYGSNLKKNFVYDLIHDNALDFTHKDTTLQLYHMINFWGDLQIAMENEIPLINFATEPLTAREIALYTRGLNFETVTSNPPLKFDFKTKYGSFYRSDDGYIYHRQRILDDLKKFIQSERKKLKK